MKSYFAIILSILLFGFTTCEKDEKHVVNETGKLKGKIGIYEGNCMPSPGFPTCQPVPISATVAITVPSENFEMNLLIDSIVSEEDGSFEINLPEGNYSLFIRDGAEFICDGWTCQSECFCSLFMIKNDSTTFIKANIDHAVW